MPSRRLLLLLAPLWAVGVGCGAARLHTASPAIAADPQAPSASVRDVPWRDRTYDLDDGPVRFSDGRYALLDEQGRCEVCMVVRAVTFGDTTGDGAEEAIVLFGTSLGGAAYVTWATVFALKDGAPVRIAEIEGGDRGAGGLESVTLEGGDVVVRRFDVRPWEGVCCPSRVRVERWRWIGGRLEKRAGADRFEPRARRRAAQEAGPTREERGDP